MKFNYKKIINNAKVEKTDQGIKLFSINNYRILPNTIQEINTGIDIENDDKYVLKSINENLDKGLVILNQTNIKYKEVDNHVRILFVNYSSRPILITFGSPVAELIRFRTLQLDPEESIEENKIE